jgi:hopanoid biosynthesis associated RND transporter like protein HpnN
MRRRMTLPLRLAHLVEACRQRAGRVLLAALLLSLLALTASWWRLGVDTDTGNMFSASLPWRQREIAYDRAFPQDNDLIVAVVRGATPEETEGAAAHLAAALAHVNSIRAVRRPDAGAWFQQTGMMFLDTKELSALLDRTIDAQPFLGQLAADPSARGLFAALTLVAVGVEHGADTGPMQPALAAFHTTLQAALAGRAEPLSWQNLLAGGLADLAGPDRFVLISPVLDHGALEPGAVATASVRAAIAALPEVKSGRASVTLTGSVPLADEQFASVAQGAVWGIAITGLLVLLWLFLAARSWRLVLPIVVTLVVGLALTTGFAAVAVGTLNLISVAFAVLFVGIAVDFAIQFSVRFREQLHTYPKPEVAMMATGYHAGPAIGIAALATAAGFLSFVPTDFSGVAELGLIAGAGMVIALGCTLTVLPAMLAMTGPRAEAAEVGFAWAGRLEDRLVPIRRIVLGGFALVAVLGLVLLPRIPFDGDPLHVQNPNTEAMRTLKSLMESPITTPYLAEVMAPDPAAADAVAKRLATLPEVAQVRTLSSFVPEDQAHKLALIQDAATLLTPSLTPASEAAPLTAADIRLAARTAAAAIARTVQNGQVKPGSPLALIGDDLTKLEQAPDAALFAANDALTRFLPEALDDLRAGLGAQPVTLANLPQDVTSEWRLPDGQVRVEAVAGPAARQPSGLGRFVDAVRSVAPDAVGSAVVIVESGRTIVSAFRTAAIGALAAIAVLLALVLRRVDDVARVLAPLLLSALMTAIAIVLVPLPINFANIIALPLLLGVGVSFNVYFVTNHRAGARHFLGSATARAILFSALTTGTAFGSLAASAHPGTASMGVLLLVSLFATLVATFVFLPALLAR